jgi:predicted amidohydrolase YtcJ
MKLRALCLIVSIPLAFAACNNATQNTAAKRDSGHATMYYGGDIITMEGDSAQYAEALVEKDGKILFVGAKDEAMKQAGEGHQMVDLKGQTLVPGFIDGHAHFFGMGGQAITANLLAYPDGNCNDIPSLVKALKEWTVKNGTSVTNGWIAGMGFDDAVLKENRFPTRQELDLVAKDTPVIAVHISGHFAVMNTKGLEEMGFNASTPNPTGGVIRREKDGKTPNGVLEELAAIPYFAKILTPTNAKAGEYFMGKGQELAASYGYTTAQEGRALEAQHKGLALFAKAGKLKIDVPSYIDYSAMPFLRSEWAGPDYTNHYRVAGLKITLDGSPQGRTAWRTIPYLLPPDGQKKGYKGYPVIPDDKEFFSYVDSAFKNNWQVMMHANGDAAIDQMIRGLRHSTELYGDKDRKTVLIHGQFVRQDQLDSLKKYHVYASLFPMHTFYWGDWYTKIVGPQQASAISPIHSALKKGVRVTSHTDAPVALPNLMMIMWTTVNRVSRSGKLLGADERLTPYQALQTITIWGADQHMEQDRKGSLKAGKLADLVILDKNPLKVDPMTLKDIKVMETIKEGKSIYRKP